MNNWTLVAFFLFLIAIVALDAWGERQDTKLCAEKCKPGTVVVECDPPRVVCEKWEVEVKP